MKSLDACMHMQFCSLLGTNRLLMNCNLGQRLCIYTNARPFLFGGGICRHQAFLCALLHVQTAQQNLPADARQILSKTLHLHHVQHLLVSYNIYCH